VAKLGDVCVEAVDTTRKFLFVFVGEVVENLQLLGEQNQLLVALRLLQVVQHKLHRFLYPFLQCVVLL